MKQIDAPLLSSIKLNPCLQIKLTGGLSFQLNAKAKKGTFLPGNQMQRDGICVLTKLESVMSSLSQAHQLNNDAVNK